MISYLALMSGQDHKANDLQNKTITAWCGWMVQRMTPPKKKGSRR